LLAALHEAAAELHAFSTDLDTLTVRAQDQFADSLLGQRQKRFEAKSSQPGQPSELWDPAPHLQADAAKSSQDVVPDYAPGLKQSLRTGGRVQGSKGAQAAGPGQPQRGHRISQEPQVGA